MVNFDVTCVQRFPTNQRGWSAKYKKHRDAEAQPGAQAGAKHVGNITVTLCISPVDGTVLVQIIFEGTSERTIPKGVGAGSVQLSYSHNHWCHEDTLHSLLELIDTHMNPPSMRRHRWACLMDCAPKHISIAFRQNMESIWKDVSRCYIDGGFTGAAQPLDRAVVRPFKEALRNAAATDLAEMVVCDLDNLSTVMNRPSLKNTNCPMGSYCTGRYQIQGAYVSACLVSPFRDR